MTKTQLNQTTYQQQISLLKNQLEIECNIIERKKIKKKISSIYKDDPFIKLHIQRTNERQNKRVTEINTMLSTLDSLIPKDISADKSMKPHSKHGILKRAIFYMEQLSSVLNDCNNFKTEENGESEKDNEQSLSNAGFSEI